MLGQNVCTLMNVWYLVNCLKITSTLWVTILSLLVVRMKEGFPGALDTTTYRRPPVYVLWIWGKFMPLPARFAQISDKGKVWTP